MRRKDGSVQGNGETSQSNVGEELDPWTAWAYKPRTISMLLIGACFLIWVSGAVDPESSASGDVVASVKRGVWAMIAVFLAYCIYLNFGDLKHDDARQFMKFLHPDLGVELPERSYGADCRIYLPDNPKSRFKNVHDTLGRLFDQFVVAHIIGWWGKAILIRNQPLLWVLSIGFEMMELTFRHMLPNFNECWWDSIILDILICNWFDTVTEIVQDTNYKAMLRVHMFLGGLGSEFEQIRRELLRREELMSLERTYAHVRRAHNDRLIYTAALSQPAVMATTASSSSSVPTPEAQAVVASRRSTSTRHVRSNTVCPHCNGRGHDKDQCFAKNGYPDWWPADKPKRTLVTTPSSANVVTSSVLQVCLDMMTRKILGYGARRGKLYYLDLTSSGEQQLHSANNVSSLPKATESVWL